jgi:hypothetical protein
MRWGLVALATGWLDRMPALGTEVPAAAAKTEAPRDGALARTRGRAAGRRCADAAIVVQQRQPRNESRRANGDMRFLIPFEHRFKALRTT